MREDPYGLSEFLAGLKGRFGRDEGRCRVCYEMRLARAADLARELGCGSFTTTLLVSHHQDSGLLREVGERVAEAAGVRFEAPELRHLFKADLARPRDLKLHRQLYCGCVFSEEERFRGTNRGD